jgi:hypothetical protein
VYRHWRVHDVGVGYYGRCVGHGDVGVSSFGLVNRGGRVMRMFVAGAMALLSMGTLAECKQQEICRRGCGPEPVPSAVSQYNQANINALCNFFNARPHEVLLVPEAHNNVKKLADAEGMPTTLVNLALGYYAYDITLQSRDGKRILDSRYARVIDSCQTNGWVG